MRMDQFPGLTLEACTFLAENKQSPPCCSQCGHVLKQPYPKIIGHFDGMFGNGYPLHRYQLKDGRFADEYLQQVEFSSGAVHFIGLRVAASSTTKEVFFAWTNEAIEAWL